MSKRSYADTLAARKARFGTQKAPSEDRTFRQKTPAPDNQYNGKRQYRKKQNNSRRDVSAGPIQTVCIIGGGPAGIACGVILAEAGVKVTLIQEARGLGGRACTRMPKGRENPIQFDFGVQMLRLRGPLLEKMLELELVKQWAPNRLRRFTFQRNEIKTSHMEGEFYVGVPRMSVAFRHLAESAGPNLKVILDRSAQVTSRSMNKTQVMWKRHSANRGQAVVRKSLNDGETRDQCGMFDAVVLAFEALKIVKGCKSGYKKARPSATPYLRKEAKKIRHHQIRVLMIAFEEPIESHFDAAEIRAHKNIRWIANNSSKPDRPDGPQCWVVHSTVQYGGICERQRIHRKEVERTLKKDFFAILRRVGIKYIPRVAFTQIARWGACTSTVLDGTRECVWDPQNRMGGCGDWCKANDINDLYSRVCDAYESGVAMGNKILEENGGTQI